MENSKTRNAGWTLSVILLLGGFLLLNSGMTGNVILNETPSFDWISFLGLLLVLCSAGIAFYTLKRI